MRRIIIVLVVVISVVGAGAFLISRQQRIAAWLVHLFTASGAVFGLLSLLAIHEGRFVQAFWLMSAGILIDSVDGVLARRAQTKVAAPRIDGALLDNRGTVDGSRVVELQNGRADIVLRTAGPGAVAVKGETTAVAVHQFA